MIALCLLLAAQTPPPPATPATPATPPEHDDFFDDGHPGYYLEWYGAEYVGVVGVGTLLAVGVFDNLEPLSLYGPNISLEHPDFNVLMDPKLNGVIGKPILREQVPPATLAIGIGAVVIADAAIDLGDRGDLHRTHAIILGGAEAIVGAEAITEVMKLGFGRLRPDFRDRYLRAACGGVVDKPPGIDCKAILADGFTVDRKQLIYGMKSFPSEHTATAFAAASFVGMQLGGAYIWNHDAPSWVRPVAGVAVGALLAGASWVAATRVEDDRHHLEDIAVGAAIGTASGVSAYLVHFDLDDHAIRRGISIAPMPVPGGAGVGVSGPL